MHDPCHPYLRGERREIFGINFRASKTVKFDLPEQSCDEAHFFLSSAFNVECCFERIDLPHPAVIVPRREKALLTIGDEGTLFGRDSMSGTCRKFELFGR